MVFKVAFSGNGERVEFGTGRTSLWEAQDYGAALPDSPARQQKVDWAWGYFAARQAGMLERLGVPNDTPRDEAIAMLADSYDLDITRAGDAPLATEPGE